MRTILIYILSKLMTHPTHMLNEMNAGTHATVTGISGGKDMVRKMMSLGLSVGTEIELLHQRGKGVVVRSKGTRIAIGESIAEHLTVESLEAQSD